MRRLFAALLPALALLVLAGCGTDDRPADERAYLDAVYSAARDNGSGIAGYGDDDNVALGRAVCDDLSGGKAPGEVARGLRGSDTRGVSDVASEIVGAAEVNLCS